MRAEKVVSALLNADGAVASIVGTRIHGGATPEGTAAPCVVFAHAGSAVDGRMSATQQYVVGADIEVMAVARTYQELKQLHEAIRGALSFKAGAIAGVQVVTITWASRGPDQYDAELREFAQSVTYRVTHMEP